MLYEGCNSGEGIFGTWYIGRYDSGRFTSPLSDRQAEGEENPNRNRSSGRALLKVNWLPTRSQQLPIGKVPRQVGAIGRPAAPQRVPVHLEWARLKH